MKWARADRYVRALVVALAAASFGLFTFGAVQYERYARLNVQAQTDAGSLLWMVYQLEREHARWNAALEVVSQNATPEHWQQAKLRYEILVSRVQLLQASPIVEGLRREAEYREAQAVLNPYVADGDRLVATDEAPAHALPGWRERADELDDVLRRLTNRANALVYNYIEDTNATLQSQGKWLLGMLGAQLLILLASLAALSHLLVSQRKQNRNLQDLSHQYDSARAEAEAANRAKDTFLANISHELRTPLQGVLGMLDLMATTPQTPRQQDYTQTARESAQHLLSLLGDMLDISTIEAGELKLEPSAVHVPTVAQEVYALMHCSSPSILRRISNPGCKPMANVCARSCLIYWPMPLSSRSTDRWRCACSHCLRPAALRKARACV
jgi:two-component system, sensor histidine kinase